MRLEASRRLEDDAAVELAAGEPTEAGAEEEYAQAAGYALELSEERVKPFPCGACGKRYASRDELQASSDGKELGCPAADREFGWCRVREGGRKRVARRRLGVEPDNV